MAPVEFTGDNWMEKALPASIGRDMIMLIEDVPITRLLTVAPAYCPFGRYVAKTYCPAATPLPEETVNSATPPLAAANSTPLVDQTGSPPPVSSA